MNFQIDRSFQNIAKSVVIIDGLANSGKSLLGPIFGYLDRSEIWQASYVFEQFSILNYLKQISDHSSKTMLNLHADELLYNLFIGRYVNFRKTDISSPFYDNLESKYIKRLSAKDKEHAINKIQKSNPILPINVHNIFGYSKNLIHGFGKKTKLYINIHRDPLFLIHNWNIQKWNYRIGKDNREFTLSIRFKDKNIPWFCKEFADEFIEANQIEKSILSVYYFYKNSYEKYQTLNKFEKKIVLPIFFEDFIYNHDPYIGIICKKLKTNRSKKFSNIIKKFSLPRKDYYPEITYENFLRLYSKKMSNKYLNMVNDLVESYNYHRSKFLIS